jgi:hypothetical protein
MNMKKLKVGSKIKVIAPNRPTQQIGTGIGLVSEIEDTRYLWIKLIGSDEDYLNGKGSCFTIDCPSYTFKVLKY